MRTLLKKYLIPGIVFQSVVIAGGYGTGREISEYFSQYQGKNALFGMLIVALLWGLIAALLYNFSRKTRSFDYHALSKSLLGRYAWLFELGYLIAMFIVLSVVMASLSAFSELLFHWHAFSLIIPLIMIVSFSLWKGSKLITQLFSFGSILLYIAYGLFFCFAYSIVSPSILAHWHASQLTADAIIPALKYTAYNTAFMPSVLFCLPILSSRQESYVAGALTGILAMIPAIAFGVVMMGYSQYINDTAPSISILSHLAMPWLSVLFGIAITGTLFATTIGLIHSVNERLATRFQAIKAHPILRIGVGLFFMISTLYVSRIGLAPLIAVGYGSLSLCLAAILIAPLVYKSFRSPSKKSN